MYSCDVVQFTTAFIRCVEERFGESDRDSYKALVVYCLGVYWSGGRARGEGVGDSASGLDVAGGLCEPAREKVGDVGCAVDTAGRGSVVHGGVAGDSMSWRRRDVGVVGVDKSGVSGRWATVNRKKKDRLKARKKQEVQRVGGSVVAVDSVATSACPSYGQVVSDAEREAKETLAHRRAAENKLQEKLALLKIASLEDEKKCREYADLKHHRMVQWTNEAVAKSQQSLEKCKSIDPGSSASQHEIRMQAKELADLKFYHEQFVENVQLECGDVSKFLPEKLICTESLERHQLEGEMYGEIDSHAEIYD